MPKKMIWKKTPIFLTKKRTILFGIYIIALSIRLWGITNPLSDFHHFRQTYTAMMARNFYWHGMNIFFPSVDIIDFNNIIEFQIYSWMVAVLYKIFGLHEILGRLLSVAFFLCSIHLFYKLVVRFLDELAALLASALLAIFPLMVYYTRTFMVESLMIFLSIASLYFFVRWLDTNSPWHGVAAVLSGMFLLLNKISAAYMLLPISVFLLSKEGLSFWKKTKYLIYFLCVILPSIYWYYLHAKFFPDIAAQKGIAESSVTGAYIGKAVLELNSYLLLQKKFWWKMFVTRIGEYQLAYVGLPVLLYILFQKGRLFRKFLQRGRYGNSHDERNKRIHNLLSFASRGGRYLELQASHLHRRGDALFWFWFLAVIIFILLFPAPNYAHEYYQIPIIPPASAILGIFFAKVLKKAKRQSKHQKRVYIAIALFYIAILPSTYIRLKKRLQLDPFYQNFAMRVSQIVNKDDLVIYWDIPRTEFFYFSGLRGYTSHALTKNDIKKIEEKIQKGAKWFVTPYLEFAFYAAPVKEYLDKNHKLLLGKEADHPEHLKALLLKQALQKGNSQRKKNFSEHTAFPGFVYKLSPVNKK